MYNLNCFKLLLDCASFKEPFFTKDDLAEYPNWQDLVSTKMLSQKPLNGQTTCRHCGQTVEVESAMVNGNLSHMAHCQDCGIYLLHPEELYVWSIDYRHYIYDIAETICGREPDEVLPEFLWNAGYAALGQQSRLVFIARIPNDAFLLRELFSRLPQGKTPILLVFGAELSEIPSGFTADRIFKLKEIAGFDGKTFSLNLSVINDQLHNMYMEKETAPPKTRKNDNRDVVAGCIRRALETYLFAMKSKLNIADDRDYVFKLPRFTLNTIAGMLDCEVPSIPTLSRIVNSDPLLKGMYLRTNDRELIRNFSPRRNR